jgi:DNA repair exonuclease SbcCD nuclease subunit
MFVKSKICNQETDSYSDITMPLQHLRLIHTSDTHLGDHLGHPSSNIALQKVVCETILLRADFLLLAGDVFDNERISDETVNFFLNEISKLETPVILLPGNHDLMHDTSIYKRGVFRDPPSNLFIFKEENGEIIEFDDQGIKFWGKAMSEHSPSFQPLSPLPHPERNTWFIGMAHGHFEAIETNSGRSSLISPAEINKSPFNYIALGHWDLYTDVSQEQNLAVYSGCPMTVGDKSGPGFVSLVDLDPEKGTLYDKWSMKS